MTTLNTPRQSRQNNAPRDAGPPDGIRAEEPAAISFPPLPSRRERGSQRKSASDSPTVRKKRAPCYPTGDGKPMAEDVLHRKLMAYCCDALEQHFATRPDVLVAGNDFVYYEEGNPKARVSPDCYVCLGVPPKGIRHFYKIWEENGIAPRW